MLACCAGAFDMKWLAYPPPPSFTGVAYKNTRVVAGIVIFKVKHETRGGTFKYRTLLTHEALLYGGLGNVHYHCILFLFVLAVILLALFATC
jgi:hypothetical protein